ncbi:MAG: hypothetical protein AB7O38_09995 [Pirellulaceae bacterium]
MNHAIDSLSEHRLGSSGLTMFTPAQVAFATPLQEAIVLRPRAPGKHDANAVSAG